MAIIMSGKDLSARITENTLSRSEALQKKPVLAGIIVGEDPASQVYFRSKEKDCAASGIESRKFILPDDTSEDELLALIDRLNEQEDIDGILIQLPLPAGINEKRVLERVSPAKDADGFNPVNAGRLMMGAPCLLPCTPSAVMELLEEYNIDPSGKDCVVIGRSNIVGKPLAMLLVQKNATVTICHSRTKDLSEKTVRADIVICAAGKKGLLTADMIKPGAVVIDVSINRNPETGKLCGDADFENCCAKASYITPVPGGVGPVTRAILMRNVLLASLRSVD